MQIGNSFGEVQKSLSWFVDAYVRLAAWRASIDRLDGFIEAVARARRLGQGLQVREGDAIDLGGVRIDVPASRLRSAPAGAEQAAGDARATTADLAPGAPFPVRALLQANGQRIEPGRHTLVTGPSGCGKSTLFRLLAGIWPFGEGSCTGPRRAGALFLPQRPYLPLGTLRDVLAYPRRAQAFDDERLGEVLSQVRLEAFAARLDERAPWSQAMSPGEQQRLAIARALLLAPDWLFLDEATSALDEETEAHMYGLVRQLLPGTTLVSIAHRPSVAVHHLQRLRVVPEALGPAALEMLPIGAD